ncbi:Uncharacterised protein [Vibrio cholerae]|nr:Uncharacterised protein [Vibrio cholerae]
MPVANAGSNASAMISTASAKAFSASSCSRARSISSPNSPSYLARMLPTRLLAAASASASSRARKCDTAFTR